MSRIITRGASHWHSFVIMLRHHIGVRVVMVVSFKLHDHSELERESADRDLAARVIDPGSRLGRLIRSVEILLKRATHRRLAFTIAATRHDLARLLSHLAVFNSYALLANY